MPQTAETDNAHLLTGANLPVPQRRPGRDTCTQQGRGSGQIKPLGDFQGIGFIHNIVIGIAAKGRELRFAVNATVGHGGRSCAVMFVAVVAGRALSAGIHKATDTRIITNGKPAHRTANRRYAADNFVSGHDRIEAAPPVIVDVMNIGMAHTAKQDVDNNILVTASTTLETILRQCVASVLRCITL